MNPRAFIPPTILLLTACAAGPSATQAPSGIGELAARLDTVAAGNEPVVVEISAGQLAQSDVVCRTETLTGTHQQRGVCAARKQRREQRRDSQEWIRSGGLRGGVSRVPTVR